MTLTSPLIIRLVAFLVAAVVSIGAAAIAANLIEKQSIAALEQELSARTLDFVEFDADGQLVTLSGTAPDEATRFTAFSIAAGVIAPDRIIDEMDVADSTGLEPSQFSIEMLRNGDRKL